MASNVYLPADHDDIDLALAADVARALDSESLFVTWSTAGRYFNPDVQVEVRAEDVHRAAPVQEPAGTSALADLLAGVAALWMSAFRAGKRATGPADAAPGTA